MKLQTTMKSIRNYWNKKFYAGYCDLQYIFYHEEPTYYNAGVYGWNCDIYCDYKRDIAISTGYRNMTGKRIPDELIDKYTKKAKAILENQWKKPYEELKAELEANKEAFLEELNNT